MAELMVISVHLTVTYRENHSAICLNIFSGCFPHFLCHLWFEISPYTDIAAVERSKEVWLRCTRLFLNVNRGIHNHRVTSVSVCRSAASFLFFHTWPKIFTHTHTQILGVVLYPIIPIHTPFQMFNHCRGLWDTVLIGNKKVTKLSRYWLCSTRLRFQPQQF